MQNIKVRLIEIWDFKYTDAVNLLILKFAATVMWRFLLHQPHHHLFHTSAKNPHLCVEALQHLFREGFLAQGCQIHGSTYQAIFLSLSSKLESVCDWCELRGFGSLLCYGSEVGRLFPFLCETKYLLVSAIKGISFCFVPPIFCQLCKDISIDKDLVAQFHLFAVFCPLCSPVISLASVPSSSHLLRIPYEHI